MQHVITSNGDPHLSYHELLTTLDPRQRAWVEVNPASIEANARKIKHRISDGCILMAVVKADGYGHGAKTVAEAALRGGASSLGVATLQEGLDLRQSGLDCPILVLGNLTNPDDLSACIYWELMPTLSNIQEILLCQNLAENCERKFKVQLKVDTGMTRLGCDLEEAPNLINRINQLDHLDLVGVYSHLALADVDLSGHGAKVTAAQKQRFDLLLKEVAPLKDTFCSHLANSAGTLRDKFLHYDMVRVGIALYGYSPISHLHDDIDLRPALAVKARVTFVREVPKGTGVSYGHSFITKRASRLAVLGIGYADGVSRSLSGKIYALKDGQCIPQVGAITMDQIVLDVTDHGEISVGSVVTLLGEDGNKCITAKEWSQLNGSIPWEVLCGFKNRLPRLVI